MAKTFSSVCKIYYEGYELTSDHNVINLNIGREEKTKSVFGNVGVARHAGLHTFEFSHEGFVTHGAGEVEALLFGDIGTVDKIMTICPTTGAEGEIAYSAKGVGLSYAPTHQIGEMVGFVGAAYSQGDPMRRGLVMATGAKTETGTGTARQFAHAVKDSEQGDLSYTTEGEDNSFTDASQDFEDWESASPNAAYLVMVTNDDDSVSWGYLGAKVSATEIKVYQEITLATSDWNGTDPSGKTPVSYDIWEAGKYLYAAMHVVAVSGTDPTLDMIIRSAEAVEMGGPTTRFEFAQKSAIGSQWQTAISADIIDTYFQASFTIGGTGADLSFTVAVILAMV